MDTATQLGASSASASFAGADCTTKPFLYILYYELLQFLSDAHHEVCRASARHWLPQGPSWCLHELSDVWHDEKAKHYFDLFSQPILLKHREIFDILRYDKEGTPRDSCCLMWCRLIHLVREVHGPATEHAESSEIQETRCYKSLGEMMLQDDLLPHQRNEPKYQIHYDIKGNVILSGKQRSWIAAMLRKNLGHKNVSYFILQHSLPELFDAPLRKEKPSQEQL